MKGELEVRDVVLANEEAKKARTRVT